MSEWVFVTPSGTRWDDSNLRHAFIKLLRSAGIRRVRFHDLRHTYVSLMAQQGSPPKYIQEQCGHSSIQVTMDIYAHLFPSGNKEWSAKLDDVQDADSRTPDAPRRVRGWQVNDNLLIYGAGEWNRTTDLRFTNSIGSRTRITHAQAG